MSSVWDPVHLGYPSLEESPEEAMGSKLKYWVKVPDDDRPWLMKISRVNPDDGFVSGEDWAEWLVHHLANVLGVPTASVRPATFEGDRAVVSRNILAGVHESLSHGNELLAGEDPEYDSAGKGEVPGYTVEAVREALSDVEPPLGESAFAEYTAYDVWAGYLLLDAWVSGRDRHHENWGVVQSGSRRLLAPSFDHGNALGFQLRDLKRARMLADPEDLARWMARGTSRHFAGQPHLVDLALHALTLTMATVADDWYSRLADVDQQAVEDAVSAVPDQLLSDVGHTFVLELLNANRRRLLDGYSNPGTH